LYAALKAYRILSEVGKTDRQFREKVSEVGEVERERDQRCQRSQI